MISSSFESFISIFFADCFDLTVYLFTIDLWPYVSVLMLLSFSCYGDDYLFVWFNGNLEGWNLWKLQGTFLFRQPFTNRIFWSMVKSFSIFISYICFSTGSLKGRKLIIRIAFSLSFSVFFNSTCWFFPRIWQPNIKFEWNNEN